MSEFDIKSDSFIFFNLDNNSNIVVKYVYDAWGNHAVLDAEGNDIGDNSHIGNLNPFRYRGYFYDTETGLYYLQTRYYDPETGRFISQDSIEYADPETINGLNLYAYCGNNPVMRTDSTGSNWWTDFWNSVAGKVVATILVVVAVVGISVLTAGIGSAITGALGGGLTASIIGGAVGGAISGAIVGAGVSIISQGIANGYSNINWSTVGYEALIGATIGAITGGIMGAVSYLRNTTALYRAVSADELSSLKSTGKFSSKLGAFEGKQFGLNLNQTRAFANSSFNNGMYAKIVKIRVPNSVFNSFTHTMTDLSFFKSGIITVAESQFGILNNSIIFMKFFGL